MPRKRATKMLESLESSAMKGLVYAQNPTLPK